MDTFVGDVVTLSMETTIDLLDLSLRILYNKPDGTIGFWEATKDPVDASKMFYVTDKTDLDVLGKWKLQAYAFSAHHSGHGKIVELTVNNKIYSEPEIFMSETVSGEDGLTV